MKNSLLYQIGLTLVHYVGTINSKKLLAYCGSAEQVFKERKEALVKIPGVGSVMAEAIIKQNVLKRAEKEIEFIEKNHISTHFFTDGHYPERLKHCIDAPLILYSKGNFNFNTQRVISIIGTRKISEYGKTQVKKLVDSLQPYNPLVVSGLAYGIDVAAHKLSLNNDLTTIGVLAHGLDRVYPVQHKSVAEKMLNNGGLVTEFISQTNPDRENFPKRNRIVAGLADVTLVVESPVKGGSMITAKLANVYNRDVFAIPGKLEEERSEGCNFLIKTHQAHLYQNIKDLEYIMGWESQKKSVQPKLFPELSFEENKVVELLKEKGQVLIDVISSSCDLPMAKTASILLELEFSGIIKSLPGKIYVLN